MQHKDEEFGPKLPSAVLDPKKSTTGDTFDWGERQPVVLITGGSGLLGTALAGRLAAMGCEARILGRSLPNKQPARSSNRISAQGGMITTRTWNPATGQLDRQALEGVTHVVNLAGAGIADQAWTKARRRELLESRTQSAEFLRQTLSDSKGPSVQRIVTASAIGYYATGEDLAVETANPGGGFLAELTEAWEHSTGPLVSIAPLTTLRIGLVLSARGGLLGPILPLTRLGLGTSMGTGRQWMSWIHEDDMVRLMIHALFTSNWTPGIYNAVAPLPRRHVEFMRTLAATLHRPLWLSMPSWPLRCILGERADLILRGVKASSQKTMDAGFHYKHPELFAALTNLLHS